MAEDSTVDPWIFMYNFWLPKNLSTNSLLLTRNLADNINSLLTHSLYVVYYTLYSYKKAKKKKMLLRKSKKRKYISVYFLNLCISRHVQFKCMLFKGQLYFITDITETYTC